MKRIFVSFLISCCVLATVDATPLVPNLGAQIKKQEKINTKNAHTARIAEMVQRNTAAKTKILIIKNRKSTMTTLVPSIASKITNTPVSTQKVVTPSIVQMESPTLNIAGVDISRVRSTWLGWYNDIRGSLGLGGYSYDARLDLTAHDWNIRFAEGHGSNHHTRNPGDGYYNFAVIDKWFIDRGIDPIVINGSKHTENVGYGYYACNSSDCTDELIRSIRTTFDFFMSEKGKTYDAHYRSIVQPYFGRIGLDIIVVPSEQRYYITIHYITQ